RTARAYGEPPCWPPATSARKSSCRREQCEPPGRWFGSAVAASSPPGRLRPRPPPARCRRSACHRPVPPPPPPLPPDHPPSPHPRPRRSPATDRRPPAVDLADPLPLGIADPLPLGIALAHPEVGAPALAAARHRRRSTTQTHQTGRCTGSPAVP